MQKKGTCADRRGGQAPELVSAATLRHLRGRAGRALSSGTPTHAGEAPADPLSGSTLLPTRSPPPRHRRFPFVTLNSPPHTPPPPPPRFPFGTLNLPSPPAPRHRQSTQSESTGTRLLPTRDLPQESCLDATRVTRIATRANTFLSTRSRLQGLRLIRQSAPAIYRPHVPYPRVRTSTIVKESLANRAQHRPFPRCHPDL